MKQCPRCNKTYTDEALNFCLEDGEMLTILPAEPRFADDPPTMVMDQARVTNPVNWPQTSPPPAQPPMQWQQPQAQPQMFGTAYSATRSPDQTLAIVSLCLGIGSLTIGWCCYIGVLLGPAAMITGFIAMQKSKKDPQTYGGRGLAIGGIVTGAIYFALLILFLIIYGVAVIGGGLAGM
jgi:hypothetical protein